MMIRDCPSFAVRRGMTQRPRVRFGVQMQMILNVLPVCRLYLVLSFELWKHRQGKLTTRSKNNVIGESCFSDTTCKGSPDNGPQEGPIQQQ